MSNQHQPVNKLQAGTCCGCGNAEIVGEVSGIVGIPVNKTAARSLYGDGLEILFRHPSRIPDTDSGYACAQPNSCLTRATFGPARKGPM